jgi:Coenzyme PQQ synthesis protein D (PqqD)
MSGDQVNAEPTLLRSDEVIWDRVDGTTVLCHTGTVDFFRLNDTGAFIWGVCDGRTPKGIIAAVCTAYPSADPELIASLVCEYISILTKERLVVTTS